MNEGKISIRYANAVYALAVEQGIQDQIYKEMCILSESFIRLPKMTEVLSSPMFTAEDKVKLLTTACGQKISALTLQFLKFVVEKGREEYMIFIAMSFQDIYHKKERIILGKISSTVPLPEETITRIKRFITVKYRHHLELQTEIDKDLLGGFVMEVSNYRFDASVKNELKRIQKQLTQL